MPQSMVIPPEWIAEAGVQNFRSALRGFRCDAEHELIALAEIEVPLRQSGFPLDANGFSHDRMVSILTGIRDNKPISPISVERVRGARPYRVYEGMHRYHASLALGFSWVPAKIVERNF
jgi:hypothetical protein